MDQSSSPPSGGPSYRDLADVAALVEGRLEEEDRRRVLERIDRDPVLYELFVELAAQEAEDAGILSDGAAAEAANEGSAPEPREADRERDVIPLLGRGTDSQTPSVTPSVRGSGGRKRFRPLPALAAALLLLALLGPALLIPQFLDPPEPDEQAPKLFARDQTLLTHLEANRSEIASPMRGESDAGVGAPDIEALPRLTVETDGALAFHAGVRIAHLRALIEAGRFQEAARAVGALRAVADELDRDNGQEPLLRELQANLRADQPPSSEDLEEQLGWFKDWIGTRTVPGSGASLGDALFVGSLTEVTRLALLSEDDHFVRRAPMPSLWKRAQNLPDLEALLPGVEEQAQRIFVLLESKVDDPQLYELENRVGLILLAVYPAAEPEPAEPEPPVGSPDEDAPVEGPEEGLGPQGENGAASPAR